MVKELTEDVLVDVVNAHDKVVVQYSASWCGNCRIMKPKMKKLASEYADITFVTIDAEKHPNSRQLATVDNLPTFAVFDKGTFKSQAQTNKFEALKSLVDEIAGH